MSSYQFGIRPTRLLAGNSVKVVEVWQAFGKYDQNEFGNFLQVRQMLTHGNKVCSNFYGKHFQNLRNFGVCSSAEMRTSCRSQKMLQNDYVLCTWKIDSRDRYSRDRALQSLMQRTLPCTFNLPGFLNYSPGPQQHDERPSALPSRRRCLLRRWSITWRCLR